MWWMGRTAGASLSCFPGGSAVGTPPANAGDVSSVPGREDPLEKGMATHSSVLAWRIPWTEEPGGLKSTESQRAAYNFPTKNNSLPHRLRLQLRFSRTIPNQLDSLHASVLSDRANTSEK